METKTKRKESKWLAHIRETTVEWSDSTCLEANEVTLRYAKPSLVKRECHGSKSCIGDG